MKQDQTQSFGHRQIRQRVARMPFPALPWFEALAYLFLIVGTAWINL